MKMVQLARAELFRAARRRSGWVLLLLPALVAAVRIAFSAVAEVDPDAAELGNNGFAPLADGLRTGGAVLTLVVLLLGALSMVRDREIGALRLLSTMASKGTIFASKLLVLTVLLALGGLLLVGGCVAVAAWQYDFGPLVEDGFEIATAAELWRDTAQAFAAGCCAWWAAGCLGLSLSAATSNVGAATLLAVVPVLLLDFFGELAQDLWHSLFLSHLPLLSGEAALARLPDICRGFSDVFLAEGEILQACRVSLVQGLGLAIVGWLVTRSRSAA